VLAQAWRQHFGHAGFRQGQEPIVHCALEGRDLLAVMPTGAGKSVCYQLPAVLLPGTTLIVSPLISLMRDQVEQLQRRGLAAFALYSTQGAAERRAVFERLRAGQVTLLYVAPERFAAPLFEDVLDTLPLARFVVDEAHCVSQWGHDFRPDYGRLAAAAGRCRRADQARGRPPLLAFTATATPEVRDDITRLLGLRNPAVFVSGFDRPNIELRVTPVRDADEKHARLPDLVSGRRALVYCATRRRTEDVAATLAGRGIAASAYHAGLANTDRSRVQDEFAAGRLHIVCATNAFGMGIDRPDIDTVVHADIPGSLEAYYQEVGRAGRDGRQAVATLLWDYADVATREFLIDKTRETRRRGRPVDPAELARRRALEHRKLQRMIAFARSQQCLRATILQYYGDPDAKDRCGACSVCVPHGPLSPADLTLVRKILSGVVRSGERYGRRRIAAMLLGDTDDLPPVLASLSVAGSLGDCDAAAVHDWIDSATTGGLLAASPDKYRVLSVTRLGRDVLTGRVTAVRLPVPDLNPWARDDPYDPRDDLPFAHWLHRRRRRRW
jgi:ATP-dependent DNA helicase RecQ